MATNYQRGRAREYRCQDTLRADGWLTTRAASSQGAFDIVAVCSQGSIRLIQCKSGGAYVSKKDRAVLETLAKGLRGKASVEIWRYPSRCKQPLIEIL